MALVTGKVVNPNGTTITTGVKVEAFCTDGGASAGSQTTGSTGRIQLTVNNGACPAGNTTVQLKFSRVVTMTTPPPQVTMNGVSATTDTNLGNVVVPV